MIIGAVDRETANAGGAHFGKRDLLAAMPNDAADQAHREAARGWAFAALAGGPNYRAASDALAHDGGSLWQGSCRCRSTSRPVGSQLVDAS
jgi:hypothetical protein